jgi:hypothetical protein
MRKSHVSHFVAMAALILLTAFGKSPGAPSMSFTSPPASQPANGTVYRFNEQPVTLTIANATRTGAVHGQKHPEEWSRDLNPEPDGRAKHSSNGTARANDTHSLRREAGASSPESIYQTHRSKWKSGQRAKSRSENLNAVK